MLTLASTYDQRLRVISEFYAKMEPRSLKNGPSSNLSTDSNLAALKISLSFVSPKLIEFDKMGEKGRYLVNHSRLRAFLSFFDVFKVFVEIVHP